MTQASKNDSVYLPLVTLITLVALVTLITIVALVALVALITLVSGHRQMNTSLYDGINKVHIADRINMGTTAALKRT